MLAACMISYWSVQQCLHAGIYCLCTAAVIWHLGQGRRASITAAAPPSFSGILSKLPCPKQGLVHCFTRSQTVLLMHPGLIQAVNCHSLVYEWNSNLLHNSVT